MSAEILIHKLRRLNVNIDLIDGNLKINAPKGSLTDDLMAELKIHRKDIITFLNYHNSYSEYQPIAVCADQDYYEVSHAQKRLWILSQIEDDQIAYNIPLYFVLNGKIDVARLNYAFKTLIDRHQVLRTTFTVVDGEPKQKVHDTKDYLFSIQYSDIRNHKDPESGVNEIINLDKHEPFDMVLGPLLRVKLLRLNDDKYLFLLNMHHIISDEWSTQILLKEILALYHGSTLTALKIQYKDYAASQNAAITEGKLEKDRLFWLDHFSGSLPRLELPYDFARPEIKTYNGKQTRLTFDSEVSKGLADLNRQQNVSLFMTLLTFANVFLCKYSNQNDIIVGTPIAGRDHPDLAGQIGYYANTLGIRTKIDEASTFEDVLQSTKSIVLKAFENQSYPFDKLVDELNLIRDISRTPLFDVAVLLQKEDGVGTGPDQTAELEASYFPSTLSISKFDLTFHFIEKDNRITLVLIYNTDLFTDNHAQRITSYFQQIVNSVLTDTKQPVRLLSFLPQPEIKKLLFEFNSPKTGFPDNITIQDLFERQVSRTPDNIAVVSGENYLSYQVLNERSNKLAHYLRNRYNITSDTRIGIMIERSEWMLVGILGIVKAGGSYVPVDLDYPQERIRYILEDAAVKCLLTEDQSNSDNFVLEEFALVALSAAWSDIEKCSAENPSKINDPSDLAYIIYTSGSTGRPKGVMVEHRNVVRLLFNDAFQFDFNDKDCWSMFHSVCFDFSVWEIFGALLYGGKLCIVPKSTAQDPEKFARLLEHTGVTVLNQIPTLFNNLASSLENESTKRNLNLRYVIFGGEALKPSTLQWWHKTYPDTKLVNMYGITETTVHVTYKEIGEKEIEEGLSNIGKPIPTLNVYIMNEHQQLVSIGIEGEIVVGGEGVARGYWNRPELTATRFMDNPYIDAERIYLSGDLGVRLENGDIKYTGRKDTQVKVRGFRIELGEIETVLLNQENIDDAIVIDRKDHMSNTQIIAYLKSNSDVNVHQLREYMTKELPDYMIPGFFIQLPSFPLTANGKIDRKALPDPDGFNTSAGSEYVAPLNKEEYQMVAIWEEVLHIKPISMTGNFFVLGGDSLKAIRLIARIKSDMSKEIKVADLFKHPTIVSLLSLSGISTDSVSMQWQLGQKSIVEFKEEIIQDAIRKKIPISQYEDIYPLTPIESGLIFSSLLNIEEPIYYDQFIYHLSIRDVEAFKKGIEYLVQKNDILRTEYYLSTFKKSVKFVCRDISVPFSIEDISQQNVDEQKQIIKNYLAHDLSIRLTFEGCIPWRMKAYHLGQDSYFLAWSFHHAVLDGWSVAAFATELSQILDAPTNEVKPLKHSYKDYCAIVLGRKESEEINQYWKKRMDGYVRNKLPFNYSGKRKFESNGVKIIRKRFDSGLLRKLEQLAVRHEISFKSICLSAHILLLHVITSEDDVVTGVVTHDRPEIEDGDAILGCFLNTVPVRINVKDNSNALEFIKNVYRYLIDTKPNELHLTDMARTIGEKASTANPIFDTILNFTDFHVLNAWKENDTLAKQYSAVSMDPGIRSAEMTNTLFDVEITKTLDVFSGRIKYWAAYFDEADVTRAVDLYERILIQFTENLNWDLNTSVLLPAAEFNALVYEFNATEVLYRKQNSMHGLFEEQVAKTPMAIALRQHGREMTYVQLNALSNQLAGLLLNKGVKNGDNIGLLTGRSFDMIVGMYAILKAGAAYVPVDPEYPIDRQYYILSNSNAQWVLVDHDYPLINQYREDFSFQSINDPLCSSYANQNPDVKKISSDLAYTIYTSGSTGRPKGVMIEHHSAVNLIEWVNREFHIGPEDNLLFITSMCFDLSVYDIFGILSAGGTVVIATQEEVHEVAKLQQLLLSEKITFWDSVPTTINYLVGEMEAENIDFNQTDLRLVFMSGDWIPVQLPDRIKKYFKNASVISLGGATEATVWSNYYPIQEVRPQWTSIPYGKPIANNFFYILDDKLNPVPQGIVGELYIGGVGVARGYANDFEKTGKAFIPDPFSKTLGGMMYKTGDLGRMLPDWNMEFIGRKDHQTKIRGYRVELGEIESQLSKHKQVRETVVEVRKDSNDSSYLCAYVVLSSEVSAVALKEHLAQVLPAYMIPSFFVFLDKLPLNNNGKVNRKALPEPEAPIQSDVPFEAPRNPVEERLSEIWMDILGISSIGVHNNFLDLGAHSLNIGAFTNRVQREFRIDLSVREVFLQPTIEQIAFIIRKKEKITFQEIVTVKEQDYYDLSHAQKRLWILDQMEEGQFGYNMPGAYIFEGELNVQSLENAFESLTMRHESLRTIFITLQGEPKQKIRKYQPGDFKLNYLDLRNHTDKEQHVKVLTREEAELPFDLSRDPLLRAKLVHVNDQTYVLLFTMHHIISDGWSMGILMNEVTILYNVFAQGTENPLLPLRIQYKDYAAWQTDQLTGEKLQAHRQYWLSQFNGELPLLNLPVDYPRPPVKTYNGSHVRFYLDENTSTSLSTLTRQLEASMFMLLLAGVKTLLHKSSNQNDIIVGSPVAGRDHIDLENQIGFYVNTLAFRTMFENDESFKALVGKVKATALNAYEHQVYPFDRLVEELDLKRDMSRLPLFDVLVVLQNTQTVDHREGMGNLAIAPYPVEFKISKFDLSFNFHQINDRIFCELEYSTDLFELSSIELLKQQFIYLMQNVCSNPEKSLAEIDVTAFGKTNKPKKFLSFNFD